MTYYGEFNSKAQLITSEELKVGFISMHTIVSQGLDSQTTLMHKKLSKSDLCSISCLGVIHETNLALILW